MIYIYICIVSSLEYTLYMHTSCHLLSPALASLPLGSSKKPNIAEDLPFKDVEAAYLGLQTSAEVHDMHGINSHVCFLGEQKNQT